MYIKDRANAGTRIHGMPASDQVITKKDSGQNQYNDYEYRDSPKVQKMLMKKLEAKMRSGKPPEGNAGNK